MKSLRILAVFLLILVIVGCGGGGSGSSGTPGITYTTDWRAYLTSGQITGNSQRVNILDLAGSDVSSLVLKNPTSGTESVNFNLPAGTYRVVVNLYSGSNADGSLNGTYETIVNYTSGTTVSTAVGTPISALSVSPSTTSIQVGRGQQFTASGQNSAGTATFISPSSVNWSVLGGIGTVSSSGNFTATTAGSGTVRATYTGLGINGAAAVTTTPFTPTRTKWTVLVYLNAANDLQSFSNLNVNQMERVTNGDVRFVVQWKLAPALFGGSFNGTRRYLVKPDLTSNIASELLQDMGTSVDMGSATTLNEFIVWAKANYPADRYALIVWNHGNGWSRKRAADSRAVSYDDERGTSIQIWELGTALGTEQFDIIAWDASLMQMIEVAYEIRNNCKYVVGSEESPPGEGYPYNLVFDDFVAAPGATTATLSKAFVDGMLTPGLYDTRKITQSVLDTSKLGALATAISTLGTELKNNSSTLTSLIQTTRNTAQSYSPTSTRVYRDLLHACSILEGGTTNTAVLNAITGVKTAANNAIVWEGHNSNSANSKGIAIDFSPASSFNAVGSGGNMRSADYALMKFGIDTQWDEFLKIAP